MKYFIMLIFIINSCSFQIFNTNSQGEIIHICKDKNPIIYVIINNNNMTKKNKQIIKDSIEYWNLSLKEKIFVEGSFENDIPRVSFEMVDWRDISIKNNNNVAGITELYIKKNGCLLAARVILSNKNPNIYNRYEQFKTTVRHEIGHIFGLNDSLDFSSLMYYKLDDNLRHPALISNEEIKSIRCSLNPNCNLQNILNN